MNFKPNLWKSLISIIGGVISGLMYTSTWSVCNMDNCPSAFERLFRPPSYPTSLLYILVILVVIYVIWSLIQKKK